jgi:hypothetical protein
MDSPNDLSPMNATMSHSEIVERFNRVFETDMTTAERHIFFLEYPSSAGKETTAT